MEVIRGLGRDALAADGGTPVRVRPFPAWPVVDDQIIGAVTEVVRSGHWWQADWTAGRVERLEEFIADRFESSSCVAVMNGSSALEAAFGALRLGPGDEVLVPATTFITTATAVTSTGATPVPIDVDRATLHLDLDAARNAVTSSTRVVCPVHLSGDLIDLPALGQMTEELCLSVVEDAAQAFGARRRGAPLGTLGDLTVLSFQAGKLLPGGEGGAVLSRDSSLLDRVYGLTHCGTSRGSSWYEHALVGSNRRMTEFQAAAILSQTHHLKGRAALRSATRTWLAAQLTQLDLGVPMGVPEDLDEQDPSMFWFWLPEDVRGRTDASRVARLLGAEGIPAAPMYPAWHLTPAYAGSASVGDCPTSVDASRHVVWLHHRLLLDGVEGAQDIVLALIKVLRHIRFNAVL